MSQAGYTPILIYSSSTASNAPAVGNLTNSSLGSELAINITDGKLFYKDNANAIQVIGWKTVPATAGGTGQTSYAVGDILYANTTTTLAKLADVATGNALISGGVGVAPSWGKIGLTTHVSGVLPVANGGTNASSASITAFNNITGYTASGATGTTSTNLVFSTSPTLTTPSVTGNATMSTGNVVMSNGQGIDFSAAGGDVFAQYDEYIAASTACQNAITTACIWKLTKIGNQVTITLPKVTGTASGSNVNFVLGANIPSSYRPTADIGFYGASVINNGSATTAPGYILITTGGTIIVYRDSSGITAWTNGATAGLNDSVGISWTI